tara:strand:- start:23697 stop:24185 length:489 start_codon:yes stop_codon:yes gene_type:complete
MKNLKRISSILVIALLVFACSKDDSNNNDDAGNGNSADQVREIAQNGTWRISYFFDSDEDETSDFSGYSFTFGEDGTLTAVNGTTTVTGDWSVLDDSSNSSSDDDGNSSDDDDFNIFFPVPESNNFEDLNDDWDIISVTPNKIELTDVSGGNGGTDFLTFEK